MSHLVEIAQFYDPEEAYCAQGYLRSHGIDTILQNEHHLTTNPTLRYALGGYRLLVLPKMKEGATLALNIVEENERLLLAQQNDEERERLKLKKLKATNWFWVPIAFSVSIPFILRFKSKWDVLVQSVLMLFIYGWYFATASMLRLLRTVIHP